MAHHYIAQVEIGAKKLSGVVALSPNHNGSWERST